MRRAARSWASTVATGVIGVLLLGAFLVEVARLSEGQGGSGNPCNGTPPDTSTVTSTATGGQSNASVNLNTTTAAVAAPLHPAAAIMLPATDLDLTALADLPISSTSSTVSDLANLTYWREVMTDWRNDILAIAPQTYIGFMNSTKDWNSWALQNIPDPPGWLAVGFIPYFRGQLFALDPTDGTQTGNGVVGFENIKQLAASVSGTSLAALDFVTFNGLTALRTYFETEDVALAICQTFPAQLVTLFSSAFDSGVPRDLRAQYLGQALAITTLMVALGGAKDGFFAKFQMVVESKGLGDAWPTVKPYLGEIGEKASGAASTATLSILQTLAARFPQDSVWVTGLTADRVESMVEVLKDKGLSDDVIQNDIQKVAQAASTSPDEDGPAGVADASSYHDGSWVQVYVRSQNRMSLYYDSTGRTEPIKTSFLQENVPGFDPTKEDFIQITYGKGGPHVYHYYGGPGDSVDGAGVGTWTPTVPSSLAQPNTVMAVQFTLLTPEDFANQMPSLQYSSFLLDVPWMTFGSQLTDYVVSGGELKIDVTQDPFAGLFLKNFEIDGMQPQLGFDGTVTYLDFQVVDAFSQPTEMRLVYNGYSDPELRITSGGTNAEFSQVLLVSSDGVKLKFLEETGGGETSEQTIYVQPPTSLYRLSQMNPGDSSYLIDGATNVYQIDQVTPTRSLEYTMITEGQKYDRGVVGAEISWVVGTQDVGLQNLILPEQAEGGADLYTPGHAVVIQSRMLDLRDATVTQIQGAVQAQLVEMVGQLKRDFAANQGSVQMGYAIISYINSQNVIQTVILEVPPS